jgi:hypothetical protein
VIADDEFIPFDPQIVSKYGPISRMSKTILRPNSSVQVSASFGDGTISTPMVRRPVPAASPVASWYFNATQGKVQETSEGVIMFFCLHITVPYMVKHG